MRPRCFALVVLSCIPAVAVAHGGIPISEQIIFRGDTLYVPSKFWGVFYGKDGGPWRWICEEAINKDQARKWAITGDGTFHVTDFMGITSSTDGGCTWVSATGEIAARQTSAVIADPVEAGRAWATTSESSPQLSNGLFQTTDGGKTWTAALTADEVLHGVAISADGQRIYVTATPRVGATATLLHLSKDRGKSWSVVTLDYQLCVPASSGPDGGAPLPDMQTCFAPFVITPIAVDPAGVETFYLRVETDSVTVLLRATSDGKASELLRTTGSAAQPGIGNLAWSADGKTLYAPTKDGMLASVAGGAFARISSLSQAECVERHGGALYACTWNYSPDFAAVSRSDDGGSSFKKVFQYAETVGPIDTCAPTTPVGKICPDVWAQYAAQLGASLGGTDAGGGDGGGGGGGGACSCTVGGRGHAGPPALVALLLLVVARVLRLRGGAPGASRSEG